MFFVEKQTAKIPGRPVFGEMLERMEKGEASGILAWHPDRLARNSVDGGKSSTFVDTGVISEMKFPTFGLIRHRKANSCFQSLFRNPSIMWTI